MTGRLASGKWDTPSKNPALRLRERAGRHSHVCHLAPVAGGVPDQDEYRDVPLTRLGERLLAPFAPVDRVVGVLEQIRARRAGETVRHTSEVPSPVQV